MKKQLTFLTGVLFFLHIAMVGKTQTEYLTDQVLQLVDSADWFRKNGQIELSIQRLQQGLELSRNASDSLQAIVAHKLGVNYFYTDSFPKALHFIGTAIELRERALPRGHLDIANSHYLRALIYRYSGQPTNGIDDLQAAVEQVEANKAISTEEKASRLSSYYTEWGILLAIREDYYQALFCWEQAEKHFRAHLSGPPLEGSTAYLSELKGTVAHDLGDYEQAVKSYESALGWQEQQDAPSISAQASLYNNLGLTYQEKGQHRRAALLFEKAMGLYQAQNDRSGMLNVYPNLIKATGTLGNFQTARQSMDAALQLCEQVYETSFHPVAAKMHYYLAETLLTGGQEEAFKTQVQRALHLLSPDCAPEDWQDLPEVTDGRAPNQTELIKPIFLKASYLYEKGMLQQGASKVQLLAQAVKTFDLLDQLISRSRQSFRVAASKFYLQQLWKKAYEQATLSCLELYQETKEGIHLDRAFQFANKNKAIVLLEGIKNLSSKELAGIPDSLLEKEEDLLKQYYQAEIAWYESASDQIGKDDPALKNRLLDLKNQLDRLTDRFEKEYPAYFELKYAPLEPASPQTLQDQLDSKSVLIEFFVGEEKIFVFFLTKEQYFFKQLDKPSSFNRSVDEFRTLSSKFGLTEPEQVRFDRLGIDLYDLLLKNELEQLPSEISNLIIVPDDVLLSLSFETLKRSTNSSDYLLQNFQISYLYTSQLLNRPFDHQRIRWAEKRFLGFGLEYDESILNLLKDVDTIGNRRGINLKLRDLGQLEYSDDEVLAIQGLLRGQVFVNEKATKANFFNHLANGNILHMAMHGLIDLENPLKSALVFAPDKIRQDDYLLYAGDIYGLQIPNNRMVMLSACNTGFGKLYTGEGIRSLSRAFMYAGAPSVVASLWGAPDKSTRDITVDYYKYLKKGLSKSQALQQAKIDFLEKASPTYRHPAYWAHLIVIGEDEALFSTPSNNNWWLIGACVLLLLSGIVFFRKKPA